MSSGGRAAAFAVLASALLWVSSAGATTITIGPSALGPANHGEGFGCIVLCTTPSTHAQRSSSDVDVAPASGVVTSWHVLGEDEGPLQLRVLEPSGPAWVGAGTSAPATDETGGENATDLEIERGDLIGIDTGVDSLVNAKVSGTPAGTEALSWLPALPDGGTGQTGEGHEGFLMLNAQVVLAPVVTSVSPATGGTAGGQTVRITGKYLDGALNVVFGSHPATTFSVDSAEQITARTPASAAGVVDVHVSNLRSTSETVPGDRYTFVAPPASGPPAGGGSGQGTGQGVALAVTGFKESSVRWRLGSALPHISSTPTGTTFAFTLSEPGNVSLTFMHLVPGRRVSGRCVAAGRSNRGRPKCKRSVAAGAVAVTGHAGLNKVVFQGHLSRTRRLAPGDYTVAVTGRVGGEQKSLTRPLTFAIVP